MSVSSGRPRRYLVATDDELRGDYVGCRAAGFALGAADGAQVVLYDRASESYLTDPYPVGAFSDERDAVSGASALEPGLLRNLGRAYLARQLEEGRSQGVDTIAYLARGHGAAALAEAVKRFRPELVLLPGTLARPSLVDRISGNTLDALRHAIDVEVRVVEPSGELRPA